MTIAEIKSDYVTHKCILFDTVERLKEYILMPESAAEELVDIWFYDWYEYKFGKSP